MPLPKRPYSKRGDRENCVHHPLYRTWHNMMCRCYKETNKQYVNYGARGIEVDSDWWNFKTFLLDMGDKPTKHHSLERIDNDKSYSKLNCKWATRSDQCVNRRRFKNNNSGYTGIQKHNYGYSVRFDYEGVRYNLGRYVELEKAIEIRTLFVKMFHIDREKAIQMINPNRVWNNSSTKIRGVTLSKSNGYVVRVTLNSIRYYVGYYKNINEAENARIKFIAERTRKS